jgi:hypothetical protein
MKKQLRTAAPLSLWPTDLASPGSRSVLLSQTPVWRFTNPRSVVIELSTVTQSTSVNDTILALPTSAPEFSEPVPDTSEIVDVVSRKTMEQPNNILRQWTEL